MSRMSSYQQTGLGAAYPNNPQRLSDRLIKTVQLSSNREEFSLADFLGIDPATLVDGMILRFNEEKGGFEGVAIEGGGTLGATNGLEIVDSLNSQDTEKALSANQGRVLHQSLLTGVILDQNDLVFQLRDGNEIRTGLSGLNAGLHLSDVSYDAASNSLTMTMSNNSILQVSLESLGTVQRDDSLVGDGSTRNPLKVNRSTGNLTDGSQNHFLTHAQVVDETDLTSNSSGHVPTQKSVKSYIDAQLSGGSSPIVVEHVDNQPVKPDPTEGSVFFIDTSNSSNYILVENPDNLPGQGESIQIFVLTADNRLVLFENLYLNDKSEAIGSIVTLKGITSFRFTSDGSKFVLTDSSFGQDVDTLLSSGTQNRLNEDRELNLNSHDLYVRGGTIIADNVESAENWFVLEGSSSEYDLPYPASSKVHGNLNTTAGVVELKIDTVSNPNQMGDLRSLSINNGTGENKTVKIVSVTDLFGSKTTHHEFVVAASEKRTLHFYYERDGNPNFSPRFGQKKLGLYSGDLYYDQEYSPQFAAGHQVQMTGWSQGDSIRDQIPGPVLQKGLYKVDLCVGMITESSFTTELDLEYEDETKIGTVRLAGSSGGSGQELCLDKHLSRVIDTRIFPSAMSVRLKVRVASGSAYFDARSTNLRIEEVETLSEPNWFGGGGGGGGLG